MRIRFFALAALALLLGACTQDEAGFLPEGAEGTPIVFTATGLNPAATATAGTRAPVDGNWEGVQSVAVLMDGTVKAYDVTPSTADPTSATLTSTDPYYWTNHNDITVTVWWPYTAGETTPPAVKVKANQSTQKDFEGSDLIVADGQTVTYGSPTLRFTHRTARVTIVLTDYTEGLASVRLTGLSTEGGNPAEITPYDKGSNTYTALVAPQSVAAGTAFITCTFTNGKTFVYKMKNATDWQAGGEYTYTVSLTAAKDLGYTIEGNGFYYLMGDIARLHSAVIAYARDFMIDRGFTYCVPPFMIRSNVVTGVMSFAEMDAMMYKIEGEDLYLIGTSEHSMIGKFIDQIVPEAELPITLTSYSPCFRKEKGAHGLEERGVYRIHQFEKQEMIVVCKPEDSMMWFDKLWKNTVDLFRSLDVPVRTLECCSGDLADLKVKSLDVEAWSPRQKKYFEVGSCSNLGDAQARRLKIRVNGENGKYLAHTLNNTVVAPPRMLIAFLENNLNADGSVNIPVVLRPYMGGKEKLIPKK